MNFITVKVNNRDKVIAAIHQLFDERLAENQKGVNDGLIFKWIVCSPIQMKCRLSKSVLMVHLNSLKGEGTLLHEKRSGINNYALAEVPWGMHVNVDYIQMIKR